MNRKELESLYYKLSSEPTDLSNSKAIQNIRSALVLVTDLERYRYAFFFLSALSVIMIASLFLYALNSHSKLNQVYTVPIIKEFKTTKRIIVKQRIEPDRRIKFLASKIKYRNPKVDKDQIAKLILKIAKEENLDPFIIGAIIQYESNFNHTAKSEKGALGIMQVMPMTANFILNKKHSNKELLDIEYNIRLGVTYYKQMKILFKNNRELALMAYNWGPGNMVRSFFKKNPIPGKVKTYSKNIMNTINSWNLEFSQCS